MNTILIAVSGYIASAELKQQLTGDWNVYVCHDGIAASEMLEQLQPDALIIDMELPLRDGMSILMEQFPCLPPVMLAISAYVTPHIRKTVASLGVHDVMELPCSQTDIVNHFNALYMTQHGLNTALGMHLFKLGISTKNDGYAYLETAIPLCAEAASSIRFQKEIYPEVVKRCSATSIECVEHAIRFAIKEAWKRRDPKVWAKYFPISEGSDEKCPSSKAFITTIARML